MRVKGRGTELTQLDDVFSDLTRGRGRLVILAGASGVGKTELARAFLERVEERDPMTVALRTRCVEKQTAYRAYGPLRELVALLGGVRHGPALATLVAHQAPDWLPGSLAPPSRNALFEQYMSLWREIAKQRRVVLMIDDIQWCDRSSLDLLVRLGHALPKLPILVLATYEGGGAEGSISLSGMRRRLGANAVDFQVRELEEEAIRSVIERVLDGSATKDLGDLIIPLARGNPFFAEQLVRWLVEHQKLRKRLFRYSASSRDMPPSGTTIDALISGRLETIEPNLRWTLEAAALSGSIVDSAVVAGQLGQEVDAVSERLRQADRVHGFLDDVGEYQWLGGGRSTRFQFKHPLVRRAFAERVTGKRFGHLISRAAETLQKLAGRGADEIADEIAGLYLRSGLNEPARVWSLKAADLTERLYAPYEMEDFLRAAARLTDNEQQRLRIENRLAGTYAATGREPEAEKLFERICESARGLEDYRTEVAAGIMLAWLQIERGVQPTQLATLTGHLVDTSRKSGEADQLVSALDLACVVAERVGRAEEALLMAEEALHVGKGSGNPELLAQAAYRLARVQISWGDPSEGKQLAETALDAFGEVNAPDGVVACHDLLGLAAFRAGQWDDALHHWTSALSRLEVAGVPEQKVAMQTNIAELRTFKGSFDEARDLYNTALRLADELEDQSLVLRCRAGQARLEFERGNYAKVLELTEAIRKDLPESGAWREDFHTTAVRALSYLELGDELQLWQEAARLEQLYQGRGGWFERRAEGDAVRIRVIDLDSDSWLVGMVADQGLGETADKDLYGEGFLQYHRAITVRAEPADARKAAERAEEIFAMLGAEPMLKRTRELLAELPTEAAAAPDWESDDDRISDEKLDSWFDSFEG